MIISNNQMTSILKTYGKEGIRSNNLDKVRGTGSVPNSKSMDQTQVSTEARAFQTALKAAMNAQEVRETKVSELKQSIDNGTYQVSGQEIADKFLTRMLVDKLV